MKKRLVTALGFVLFGLASCAPAYSSGPNCTTGKLCGNTCISKTYTCHK